jgi:hypothetical protein
MQIQARTVHWIFNRTAHGASSIVQNQNKNKTKIPFGWLGACS